MQQGPADFAGWPPPECAAKCSKQVHGFCASLSSDWGYGLHRRPDHVPMRVHMVAHAECRGTPGIIRKVCVCARPQYSWPTNACAPLLHVSASVHAHKIIYLLLSSTPHSRVLIVAHMMAYLLFDTQNALRGCAGGVRCGLGWAGRLPEGNGKTKAQDKLPREVHTRPEAR